MIEWSNVLSPATLLGFILAAVGFGGWIFRLGGQTKDIINQGIELERLKREAEQFQIAINAGLIAVKGAHSEFREEIAKNYATKHELAEVERRTTIGIDRVVDRLEQLSTRLETIGDAIIKTLATR